MIDWHTHILPGMDDGSRNEAETLSLLEELRAQGVDTVAATSHFYANDESVERFLERREEAYHKLCTVQKDGLPSVMLGAEVRYYPGISHMNDLDKLVIQGSCMLLIEMSASRWTEYTLRELITLAGSGKWEVMLAHVERYLKFQSADVWERLLESGVMMQTNASFFTELGARHKALSMLNHGRIHFIGSDCHNMTSRPPKIGKAFEIIEKKLGSSFANQFTEYSYSMLAK